MGHIKMMGAVQPFISGAISKTVNLPEDATVEDIEQAYIEGWKHGLKALAIYRDGSKRAQVLSTSKDGELRVRALGRGSRPPAPAQTRASPSPTSSPSKATKATSPPASTKTAPPARSG